MKMRACLLLIAIFSLAGLIGVFGQSRARRVGQTPAPSPSAGQSGSNGTIPDSGQTSEEVGNDDVVKVSTTLVTVPVTVSDRDGRFIYDLRKEDFKIFDNGQEQQVAYFGSTEKPFTVILMLDTSASTWKRMADFKDAATEFLSQLRPADKVMVTSFAKGLQIECEPTTDRRRAEDAIRRIDRGSSTHLYDAMDRVMNRELNAIQHERLW